MSDIIESLHHPGNRIRWENKNYEYRGNLNGKNQGGCMEEQLNYVNRVCSADTGFDVWQLDLFVPVKPKFTTSTKLSQ